MKRFFLAATVVAWSSTSIAAFAQSSLTIYGNFDVALDRIEKSEGNVQGTVFGSSGGKQVPNAVAAPRSVTQRISPSLSRQSNLGFKGTESLGQGYSAFFNLEASLSLDTGMTANDGRLFGRQSYVGLGSPFGEVKIGRQASPMLAAYFRVTTEALGSTDLLAAGLVINTLQQFQDNALSYSVRHGSWSAMLSYSTNAGVGSGISAARSFATGSTPAANAATGQIVGGATAGAETAARRGRAQGAMLAYANDTLTVLGALHRNDFGDVPVGIVSGGVLVPLFEANSYQSALLGAKYKLPNTGTSFAATVHLGRFDFAGTADPLVRTYGLGAKQAWGALALGIELVDTRFVNFTKGVDRGYMMGLDYQLSMRSALYMRAGVLSDKRGRIVKGDRTPLAIAGGPATMLIPLGAQEVPLFSGAGQNIDARTKIISIGMRHAF